ncbi:MAG: nickel-responsive transcriptional regulator NikR [Lentisphaerae bacterium]|nr:nickel-responsive transcriptional regulator NikR [Lentisphaerota bacterium]
MITRFSTALEPDLLAAFDRFIKRHGYRNRSEAVRDLIRKNLVDEEWRSARGSVVGVISLVYAHRQHSLQDRLTDLQHTAHDLIISTTHIHLDRANCLEVIMVRGPAVRVKALADSLITLRGVRHGGLTIAAGRASK